MTLVSPEQRAPIPPPVQATETGPVSEQERASIPEPGPAGAQGRGPVSTSSPNIGATYTQGQTAGPFIAALAQVQAAKAQPKATGTQKAAQLITKAISLGLDAMPGTSAGWARLIDKYTKGGGGTTTAVGANDAQLTAQIQQANAMAGGRPTPLGLSQNAPSTRAPAPTVSTPGHWTPAIWASTVLKLAGLPTSGTNVDNMLRWMQAESGSLWDHDNNPLNTGVGTSAVTGSSGFPNLMAGAQNTADALRMSNYTGVYAAFKGTADASAVSRAIVSSPWASSHYGGTPTHIAQMQPLTGGVSETPAKPTYPSTQSVVSLASSQLGVPYQWAGESAGRDFDCSGLVQWAYHQVGISLPRVAQTQYDATARVARNAPLQPGDLLFFGWGPNNITHVGIYVGNGTMIDAPHTGADVRTDLVFPNLMGKQRGVPGSSNWGDYVGATRPTDHTGATTSPVSASAGTSAFAPPRPSAQYNQLALEQYVMSQMEALNL